MPTGLAPQPEVFSFFLGAVKCRERVPPPVVSEDKSVFELYAWTRGEPSLRPGPGGGV